MSQKELDWEQEKEITALKAKIEKQKIKILNQSTQIISLRTIKEKAK